MSQPEDLSAELRTVLSVLALTAGINNDNHPCLTKYSDLGPYPSNPDISDAEKRVLNAIVTILVLRSEVLALMPCEPPSSPAQSKRATVKTPPYAIFAHQAKPNDSGSATLQDDEPSDDDEDDGDEDDDDDEDEEDKDEDDDNNDGGIIQKLKDLSAVAVVANPDKVDQYFKNVAGPEQCIIVNGAKSHMSKILDASNHWEQCLQIS
jgi:hypothetical protein